MVSRHIISSSLDNPNINTKPHKVRLIELVSSSSVVGVITETGFVIGSMFTNQIGIT